MKEIKIFIVSSKEYLRVAHALKARLEDLHESFFTPIGISGKLVIEVWDEGGFNKPQTIHQTLTELSPNFGVILFSGDDKKLERGETNSAPRDNVIYEYGLLTGKLGPDKVHLLAQKNVKIASDLAGVNYIDIEVNLERPDITGNLTSPANKLLSRITEYIKSNNIELSLPATQLSTTSSSVVPTKEEASTTSSSVVPTKEEASTTLPSVVPTKEETSTTLPSAVLIKEEASTTSSSVVPTKEETSTTSSSVVPTKEETSTTSSSVVPTKEETSTTLPSTIPNEKTSNSVDIILRMYGKEVKVHRLIIDKLLSEQLISSDEYFQILHKLPLP